jgi:hypothetical protein
MARKLLGWKLILVFGFGSMQLSTSVVQYANIVISLGTTTVVWAVLIRCLVVVP